MGFSTELKAEYGAVSDDECTAAFTGLENVQEATCIGSPYDIGGGGAQYNVTFSRWPRQVHVQRYSFCLHVLDCAYSFLLGARL